jgi:hypothetical protein
MNIGKMPMLLSQRDGRFDGRVRVVADELEIFEFEVVNVFNHGI